MTSGKPLPEKMFLRPGYAAAVLGAPPGFEGLEPVPGDVEVAGELAGPCDWILVFHTREEELRDELPGIVEALKEEGLLWIAYPKGGDRAAVPTDLKREVVWQVGRDRGLTAVAQVAVDDVWSALRFKRG